MAVHGQNFHTIGCGLPEGCAETGVCGIVWVDGFHIRHLDHEEDIGTEPVLCSPDQSLQVLGTPLCGSIRKGTDRRR